MQVYAVYPFRIEKEKIINPLCVKFSYQNKIKFKKSVYSQSALVNSPEINIQLLN